jgi:hypothetical protein
MRWEGHAAGIRGQKAFVGSLKGRQDHLVYDIDECGRKTLARISKTVYNFAAKGFLRYS